MRRIRHLRFAAMIAPGLPRAILCTALALTFASCKRPGSSPSWDAAGEAPPAAVVAPVGKRAADAPPAKKAAKPSAAKAGEGLRFINYNVKNWLTMDRRPLTNAPKPAVEKQAVITLLARHQPDVIGLSEIGTPADLAEVQAMLRHAGIELPYSHHAGGADPVRHLGLLSRFPITSTARPQVVEYHIDGKLFGFSRGILDATVTVRPETTYRFLGAHLKSKRDVKEGDHEMMRMNEARLLRKHIDAILHDEPAARLIVYGDFNDTRPSPSFRIVTGNFNDPGYLTAIRARDSKNQSWTHFWEHHEIYSRIDFITVSRALRPEVRFDDCYLIEDSEWENASDHRPMMAIFR